VEGFAGLGQADGQSLYQWGCAAARLAATIRKAEPSPAGEQMADVEAARAVGILRKAVPAGATRYAEWQQDPALDPIRKRADFQELLAGLRPKEPAPQ
jgi:hypothetical protein